MPRLQLLVPRVAAFAALLLALAAPGVARAAFFGAETIDGPSGDVARVGGVDLARDGSGTVVYVKRVAGIEHVFASRLVGGVWQPGERLDPALPLPSSDPVVGVANGGAATIAFLNSGQLYTVVRRAQDTAWPGPTPLGDGGAASPSIDLSVNGVGYVVWSRSQDVRAAWLSRSAREFSSYDAPVDIVPAADAGSGTGRPRVAASADGTALVAWGEAGRVYARRLLREAQSTLPQELGVGTLDGHPGGSADLPEVDIADDSSFAWVAFRQAFDANSTTRVLVRRLVGSAFDPPADVGSTFGAEGTTDPAVDVAGIGDAVFAADTTLTHTPIAALNYAESLRPPFPVSGANAGPTTPAVAVGETSQALVAWFDTDSGVPSVNARSFKFAKPADPETPLADLSLGAVDTAAGLHAAADRYGNAVIAFVQGVSGGRRLVVARWDRPPVNLIQTTTFRWRSAVRPLGWTRVSEPWGPITYTVAVDGHVLGTTENHSFPIAGRVRDGLHRWSLTATDPRGQSRSAGPRSLRIDSHGPRLGVRISGRRTPGATLRFVFRVRDRLSGPGVVRVDFGDGARASGRAVSHRFAGGSHLVTITASDKAGNSTVVRRRLAIGR